MENLTVDIRVHIPYSHNKPNCEFNVKWNSKDVNNFLPVLYNLHDFCAFVQTAAATTSASSSVNQTVS